uniref:Uncharacterized protein n=1 Tax=Ciona intestinalis TaxID=7719 RepID=H2XR66_CIOIN
MDYCLLHPFLRLLAKDLLQEHLLFPLTCLPPRLLAKYFPQFGRKHYPLFGRRKNFPLFWGRKNFLLFWGRKHVPHFWGREHYPHLQETTDP